MSELLNGACLCNAVTFEIDGPFRDVVICHCQQCARWTGHQVAATAVPPERLRICDDQSNIRWYAASDHAKRGFCSACGSSLFWKPTSGDRISIMAGAVDDPDGILKTGAHVHVADQRAYVQSANDAPRHDALPRSAVRTPVSPDD